MLISIIRKFKKGGGKIGRISVPPLLAPPHLLSRRERENVTLVSVLVEGRLAGPTLKTLATSFPHSLTAPVRSMATTLRLNWSHIKIWQTKVRRPKISE